MFKKIINLFLILLFILTINLTGCNVVPNEDNNLQEDNTDMSPDELDDNNNETDQND